MLQAYIYWRNAIVWCNKRPQVSRENTKNSNKYITNHLCFTRTLHVANFISNQTLQHEERDMKPTLLFGFWIQLQQCLNSMHYWVDKGHKQSSVQQENYQ